MSCSELDGKRRLDRIGQKPSLGLQSINYESFQVIKYIMNDVQERKKKKGTEEKRIFEKEEENFKETTYKVSS